MTQTAEKMQQHSYIPFRFENCKFESWRELFSKVIFFDNFGSILCNTVYDFTMIDKSIFISNQFYLVCWNGSEDICNGYSDLLSIAFKFKNIEILS